MALPSPAAVTGYVSGTNNFDAAMKQIYRPSNVKKLTYDMRPLTAMMPKFEGFGGRNMPVVVKWGHPCYMHAERNIAIIGAFRGDFRLSFFNAALMRDPEGALEKQGPNTRHADMIRFTDNERVADLEPTISAPSAA